MTDNVIGALRHRVTLEGPVRIAAEGGTATVSWTSLGSLFARIEPIGGREVDTADGTVAVVTHKVLIRHRNDVSAPMRFVAGTRILEIRAVLDLEGRRRWMQCLCEERLP